VTDEFGSYEGTALRHNTGNPFPYRINLITDEHGTRWEDPHPTYNMAPGARTPERATEPPTPPPVADPHPEYRTTIGTLSTEDLRMLREMHSWLAEIMPAVRVAIKMMDARASLMKRWRGNAKG
jgi:hypothetical protein